MTMDAVASLLILYFDGAAATGQLGALDAADLHAGHAHFVAFLELLQGLETGDKRVALVLENLPAAQRLERHPDEGEAEEKEEPDAGRLLCVVHGSGLR
jgi:hypothetical protein